MGRPQRIVEQMGMKGSAQRTSFESLEPVSCAAKKREAGGFTSLPRDRFALAGRGQLIRVWSS
jgi:hypothetical protein